MIAVTFQRLISDPARHWAVEEDLVLQALRRSTNALRDADAEQLSDYLGALSEDQLRGVASNVKGIYHELLFVEAENSDWDEVSAQVREFTNHPGGDVEFILDGATIGQVQLKAVASEAEVLAHLARYPEIDIRVTEEVAARMPGVEGSGFHNVDLTRDVRERLSELKGDGVINEVTEGLAGSILVSSAIIAGRAARGKGLTVAQVRSMLVDAGGGVTTAALLDVLLMPIVN